MTSLEKVRRAAFNSLARRDHSIQELTSKLKAKGHAVEHIQTIVAELLHNNLLNEARFAESYTYSRSRKGYGPKRIAIELQSRGLSQDIIANTLETYATKWPELAQKTWQKHFKGKYPADLKERFKQIRFLQMRGFTSDHIEIILTPSSD